MRSKKTMAALGILGLGLLTTSALWAATARVEGVVVGQDEEPIAGAVVTITATDGSDQQTDTTNRRGKFSLIFREMAPDFTIRVEAAGYAPYEGPIELREGRTLEVTIPLLTEQVAEKQRAEIAAIEARNKAARRYNEGAKKYNEGDLEAAASLFQEAVEEEADLAIAWAGLGRIYLEQERWSDAAQAFERFEAIEPGREPVLLMLYDSYVAMGSDRAEPLLERLIAEFPAGGTAARIFNQGVAAIKGHDLQTARVKFQAAIEMHPDLYQAHLNLAHIARAHGDWETTLAEVDEFLAREPEHARALALRYQALKNLESPEAEAALAGLRESAPGEAAQIFHEQGVTLFNAGETEAALEAFLAAIDIRPDHARAHYRAGLCYASFKNNAQARSFLEKFIELAAAADPEVPIAKEMLTYL